MRPIPGFEGRYSACEDGRIYSHVTGRYLKPAPCGEGGAYLHVNLGRGNSKNVHALVLLAFKGSPPPSHEARHLDGNGHNNAISNLAWSTHSKNLMDKHAHGTMTKGESHHQAVLTDAQVGELRSLRTQGLSYPALGRCFGISKSQAHRICTGQSRAEK